LPDDTRPYVPPEESLPELTAKALLDLYKRMEESQFTGLDRGAKLEAATG
jgi:hypothetical protein